MFTYKCEKIEARSGNKKRLIVSSIAFNVDEGKSLALIGESGSGKTMIANSIMGLLPENISADGLSVSLDYPGNPLADSGDGNTITNSPENKASGISSGIAAAACVTTLSAECRRKLLGRSIVCIPQSALECLNPSRIIKKQMYDSVFLCKKRLRPEEKHRIAVEKLSLAGFDNPEEILGMYPFQLSGGMGQRLTIAIAACSDAGLVIADEPTNGLDEKSKSEFSLLMKKMFPKAAKLVITHDISVAKECDDILVICKGKLMEKGPSAEVLDSPRHPYTGALLAALPQNGLKETFIKRSLQTLCPFYSRCEKADFQCTAGISTHTEVSRTWNCNH